MIPLLVLRGLRRGKARFACAAAGIALAVGALVFTASLVSTNAHQSLAMARRLLDELPVQDDARTARLTLDYRPAGHVMQGPPMRVMLATDASAGEGITVTRALFAQRRLEVPPIGTELTLVGRNGTVRLPVSRVLDWEKPLRGYPNAFVSPATARLIGEEWTAFARPDAEALAPLLKGDEERRMDYATPLLLAAALLTALSLLVNSLLLSVEANRPVLMTLRLVGLTKGALVGFVAFEALLAGAIGWLLGALGGIAALTAYVAADPVAFPSGPAIDVARLLLTLRLLPIVIAGAVLFALRPVLAVRPLDRFAVRARSRRRGMAVTFAFGFASFVAVEVWGASLMRAFVPSPEWPDAIVSLLPAGVSSFDIDRLRGIPGVARISELLPLQVPLPDDGNALFLASEWLPPFRFIEGSHDDAVRAVAEGKVVITEMMSRARRLHRGDELTVRVGRPPRQEEVRLEIAGVVDLNWHMVTSRGLVRGLNGAPPMTDGPVFASFDTVESLDMRPAPMVRMTHLWVDYEPDFLSRHGVFEAGRLIEAAVAERLGHPATSTVRLHARDEIADGTLAHGSDLIGQAARVPFVFLAILSIGFIAMLVAEAEGRRRELMILRTVGATRGDLARRLALAAVGTALTGIALGLPLGSLAGWLATFRTGNWPGLPHWFVLPVGIVAEGAVGSLVFALLFAVPTALALVRRKETVI